jgi:phage shock protein A
MSVAGNMWKHPPSRKSQPFAILGTIPNQNMKFLSFCCFLSWSFIHAFVHPHHLPALKVSRNGFLSPSQPSISSNTDFKSPLHKQSFHPSSSAMQQRKQTSLFMFGRIIRFLKSNINYWLNRLEDPEKLLEQAVRDMETDLIKIRQSYADLLATQKRIERQKDSTLEKANQWYVRAKIALEKGDEDLSKEALRQRQHLSELKETQEKQLEIQRNAVLKLTSSIELLEKKIGEAKRQKESFISRAKAAKTSLEINNMLASLTGKMTTDNSMEAFERMKEKVESLEIQAEIMENQEATPSMSLEERFKSIEGDEGLEEEFNKLKMKNYYVKPIPTSSRGMTIDTEFDQLKSDMSSEGKIRLTTRKP